jgi:hypothetical protein
MIDERKLSAQFHAALDVEPPPGAIDRLAAALARSERKHVAWGSQWIAVVALILVGVVVGGIIASRNAAHGQPARHAGAANKQPVFGGGVMAYDAGRRETVALGCSAGMWVWDGHAWTNRDSLRGTPPSSPFPPGAVLSFSCGDMARPPIDPNAMVYDAMAYDATRGRIVLLSSPPSQDGSATATQTWTWNGQRWQQEHPATALPFQSSSMTMAYDPAVGRVVVLDVSGQEMVTRAWDGRDWRQVGIAGPSLVGANEFGPMAYDAKTRRLIALVPSLVFDRNAYRADPQTWAFDGSNWRHLPTPSGPKAGSYLLASDAAGHIFLFGTADETGEETFWSWSGSAWVRLKPPHLLPNGGGLVAPDPATGGLVVTGTFEYSGKAPTQDETWVWDGRDWTRKACYLGCS